MLSIHLILILLWIHFITDFFLQDDETAINKSKSNYYLSGHCLIYMIPFLPFGIYFGLLLFISHFVIDYVTSRITTKLFLQGKRHWFFCTIGIDQALHLTVLFLLSVKFL